MNSALFMRQQILYWSAHVLTQLFIFKTNSESDAMSNVMSQENLFTRSIEEWAKLDILVCRIQSVVAPGIYSFLSMLPKKQMHECLFH